MPESAFTVDTAVDAVPAPAGTGARAERTFAARVTDRWSIGSYPNGGYLLAIVARALGAASSQPDPLTVTAHFLRPPVPGPALVEVEQLRAGRTQATVMARLMQGDSERMRVLATFGNLDRHDGPTHVAGRPPPLPPPEDCVRATRAQPGSEPVALLDHVDLRVAPDRLGWTRDLPAAAAEHHAWLRIDGVDPADAAALVLAVDALPPAVFALTMTRAWVPTIELTVHLRARPAPGWLRVAVATRFLMDGYLEEDAEVWDAEGRLVAQSRQLARMT